MIRATDTILRTFTSETTLSANIDIIHVYYIYGANYTQCRVKTKLKTMNLSYHIPGSHEYTYLREVEP